MPCHGCHSAYTVGVYPFSVCALSITSLPCVRFAASAKSKTQRRGHLAKWYCTLAPPTHDSRAHAYAIASQARPHHFPIARECIPARALDSSRGQTRAWKHAPSSSNIPRNIPRGNMNLPWSAARWVQRGPRKSSDSRRESGVAIDSGVSTGVLVLDRRRPPS